MRFFLTRPTIHLEFQPKLSKMRISLPKFHCDIVLAKPDLSGLSDYLTKSKGNYTRCALISDTNVFPRFGQQVQSLIEGQGIPLHPILIEPGEIHKSLESAALCWQDMHKAGLDRNSLVVGLGGGVITDLAGFTASCYMRGIDVIHVPTTLLAMVDSSIGGKNGINLVQGKNLVGTLHHPRLVVIAPHFLADLPLRELSSGLAEIIKAGVIRDAELFEFLERYMGEILAKDPEKLKTIIAKACKIKTEIIRIDEKEQNLRSILNYGHTFGHAIETATDYALMTHGEAVAIGMSCAAKVSRLLNYVDDEFVKRQDALCRLAGLPIDLPKQISIDLLVELMRMDKKAVEGKIALIVPRSLGKVDKITDVDPALIKQALRA